jgi:hypothetical protein
MTTQGAMVLPVVTRGMIEPSAMRRFFDPIDLQLTVYDRHRIAPHFRGARLMVIGGGRIADEVFDCSSFQVARHDFAFGEGLKPNCQSRDKVPRTLPRPSGRLGGTAYWRRSV